MIHIARALFDETSSSGKPGPVLFDGSMVPVLYIFIIIRCCTNCAFLAAGLRGIKSENHIGDKTGHSSALNSWK